MAFTHRYVTASGSAVNGGTNDTTDAWDLLTGIQSMTAGIKLWIKKGAYSIGTGALIAYTPVGAGTAAAPSSVCGYNVTPGDLTPTRDKNGVLVTADYPVVTMAWQTQLNFKDYTYIDCIKVVGGRTNGMMSIANYSNINACWIEDSGTTGNAIAIWCGACCSVTNCDIIRTNSDGNGNGLGAYGNQATFTHNRIKGHSTTPNASGIYLTAAVHAFGNTVSDFQNGLYFGHTGSGWHCSAVSNTIYNCPTAGIVTVNNGGMQGTNHLLFDNHITDCGRSIDHLYYATGATPASVISNRTRDNTNADRGGGDWERRYAITVDNGAAISDFIDPTNRVLMLRPDAAGRAASVIRNKDIGAQQGPPAANSMSIG